MGSCYLGGATCLVYSEIIRDWAEGAPASSVYSCASKSYTQESKKGSFMQMFIKQYKYASNAPLDKKWNQSITYNIDNTRGQASPASPRSAASLGHAGRPGAVRVPPGGTAVPSAASPFAEDGFQEEAGQEEENIPRELRSWSIRVWGEKVFQVWKKIPRVYETCCGRLALREWSRDVCTCSGKALFSLGLLSRPCPAGSASAAEPEPRLPGHEEGSAERGMKPNVGNAAQLQEDVLPFSLYLPRAAAGNRNFCVTWRAEGESVCCF